uniref:Uncharacterized protein n=1 Tax=Gossypium raimondii TaxID=29730 RepID=A0A0D2R9X8_GOSRA|nr:hypothetical protein B456_004G241200 [Gossypium raimondii]
MSNKYKHQDLTNQFAVKFHMVELYNKTQRLPSPSINASTPFEKNCFSSAEITLDKCDIEFLTCIRFDELETALMEMVKQHNRHQLCARVAEKTAFLRPIELKLVPVPWKLRKIKIVKQISQMLVNHLGLNLTKDDLQNVVDLMEPYGQISNGIEYLNPPLDVSN